MVTVTVIFARRSALLLSLLITVVAGAQTAETAAQHAAKIQQRIQYFHQQRAYPLTSIPSGARTQAIQQTQTMHAAPSASGTTPAWQLIGPQPVTPAPNDPAGGFPTAAGRVTALAVNPANPATVYLGAAEGGVWKSTNSGTTWAPMTDSQVSLAVGSIAIDPTDSTGNTVYVGTGEANNNADAYYGAGILKSTDGGASWSLLGSDQFKVCSAGQNDIYVTEFAGSYIGAVAVNPSNAQILLAAVQDSCNSGSNGIVRSTDGGATWTNVIGGANGSAAMFASDGTAYAALGEERAAAANGIYKSTDGGATWTAIKGTGANVVPSGTAVGRIALVVAPSSSTTLYAAFQAKPSGGFGGLYTTTDGGKNWSKLPNTPDFCTTQCNYNIALGVSPANANIIYGTGIYTYATSTQTTVVASTDGGNTWTDLGASTGGSSNLLHTDGHAVAFAPDGSTVFVGNDGGAWSGSPAGTPTALNWTSLNATLANAQFSSGFALNPANTSQGIGGTQDNGALIYTGSLTWPAVTCGDGGFNAIDHTTTPATFYAGCSESSIHKSTDPTTASSWTSADAGINKKDPALFYPPLVNERKHPGVLYFGTDRVYQLAKGASSWTPISPEPLPAKGGDISAIGVSPSKPSTIYAGASDGTVEVTTDTGSTWSNITGTGALPGRYVTQIAVEDKSPTTAYVTFSGFSGFSDTLGHVFRTTDGGSTWTDISSNLPNIPVNDLVVDRAKANTFYAATDIGVFVTTDGGATWSVLGTGLPRVAVVGLGFDENGGDLIAATHGRSAWRIHP